MFDQRCPHCSLPLGRKKLAILDPRRPTVCPGCGELVFNTWRGVLLAIGTFLVIALSVLLVLDHSHWRHLFLLFLPLAPVVGFLAFAAWAEPRAIQLEPKLCQVCHREDVGYYSARDTGCADCTERLERERVAAVAKERNARKR